MTNQTIYDSLKNAGYENAFKRHTGDVGIEIETESKNVYQTPQLKFWNAIQDGSLRDFGIEYLLKGPVGRGRELQEALKEWDDKVNNKFKLIPDSNTTSVHVHLNFLNNSWIELANFWCTYFLVENLLQKIAGPDRLSNLFAMPLCDAEGELDGLLTLVRHIGILQHRKLSLSPENYKYAALNLCNLTKLGTMEVRSLEGTTDIKRIETWVNILLSIKDFSCQKDLIPTMIVDMADKQGGEIIYPIFGQYVDQFNNVKNQNDLIQKNLYFVAKIASASKFNDSSWGFPKPKKIYKEKFTDLLNKLSIDTFSEPFDKLVPHHRIVIEEMLTRQMNVSVKDVTFEIGDDF